MTELSSNQREGCGAVLSYSVTCQREQVAVMGLAPGKMSPLSRAGAGALGAGLSAFDLAEMARTRFVICYLLAGAPGESSALPAARRFTSCRSLAGGAAADLGAVEIQEGGRGSRTLRERSHLIHYAEKKIFTLPHEL